MVSGDMGTKSVYKVLFRRWTRIIRDWMWDNLYDYSVGVYECVVINMNDRL